MWGQTPFNQLGLIQVIFKNFIFFSTQAVYGDDKDKYIEEDIPKPSNHYGKSKYLAERLLLDWRKNDYKLAIIRPSAVFGNGSIGNISRLINQIQSKKFIMIGDGNNIKSICYVKNLIGYVKHCMKLLESKDLLITNYADKPDYSMNELINQIKKSLDIKISSFYLPYWMGLFAGYFFDFISKVTRKKYTISSIRIKKFCGTTQFDAKKAYLTGFKAPYTLEQGLNKTIQYEVGKSNQ